MRRPTAVLAVIALALVAGACGDDGDDDAAAATTTTATTEGSDTTGGPAGSEPDAPDEPDPGAGDGGQEYLDAANAECRAAFDEIDALPEPEGGDEVAAYLQQVSALNATMIEEIRGLEGPSDVVAEVEAVLVDMEATLAKVDRLAGSAAVGDQDGYEELGDEIEADNEAINEELASIGLTVCAED